MPRLGQELVKKPRKIESPFRQLFLSQDFLPGTLILLQIKLIFRIRFLPSEDVKSIQWHKSCLFFK